MPSGGKRAIPFTSNNRSQTLGSELPASKSRQNCTVRSGNMRSKRCNRLYFPFDSAQSCQMACAPKRLSRYFKGAVKEPCSDRFSCSCCRYFSSCRPLGLSLLEAPERWTHLPASAARCSPRPASTFARAPAPAACGSWSLSRDASLPCSWRRARRPWRRRPRAPAPRHCSAPPPAASAALRAAAPPASPPPELAGSAPRPHCGLDPSYPATLVETSGVLEGFWTCFAPLLVDFFFVFFLHFSSIFNMFHGF